MPSNIQNGGGGVSPKQHTMSTRTMSLDSLQDKNSLLDQKIQEYLPTRVNRTTPKINEAAMQFVKTGPASLYKSATEQIKKAEAVKEMRKHMEEVEVDWQQPYPSSSSKNPYDEGSDWQSNLDKWKSSRRKRNEEALGRVIEIKKNEQEEELSKTRRKSKTFSEMREDKTKRGRRYNLVVHDDDNNDLTGLLGGEKGPGDQTRGDGKEDLIDQDNKDAKSDAGFCTGSDTGSDGVFAEDNISDTSSALGDKKEAHDSLLDSGVSKEDETHMNGHSSIITEEFTSSVRHIQTTNTDEYTYDKAIAGYKQYAENSAKKRTSSITSLNSNTSYTKDEDRKEERYGLNRRSPSPGKGKKLEGMVNFFAKEMDKDVKMTPEPRVIMREKSPKVDVGKRRSMFETRDPSSEREQKQANRRSLDMSGSLKNRVASFENLDTVTSAGSRVRGTTPTRDTSLRKKVQSFERLDEISTETKYKGVTPPRDTKFQDKLATFNSSEVDSSQVKKKTPERDVNFHKKLASFTSMEEERESVERTKPPPQGDPGLKSKIASFRQMEQTTETYTKETSYRDTKDDMMQYRDRSVSLENLDEPLNEAKMRPSVSTGNILKHAPSTPYMVVDLEDSRAEKQCKAEVRSVVNAQVFEIASKLQETPLVGSPIHKSPSLPIPTTPAAATLCDDDSLEATNNAYTDDDINEVIKDYENVNENFLPNHHHQHSDNIYENITDEPVYENIYEKVGEGNLKMDTVDHHYQTLEEVRADVAEQTRRPPSPPPSLPPLPPQSTSIPPQPIQSTPMLPQSIQSTPMPPQPIQSTFIPPQPIQSTSVPPQSIQSTPMLPQSTPMPPQSTPSVLPAAPKTPIKEESPVLKRSPAPAPFQPPAPAEPPMPEVLDVTWTDSGPSQAAPPSEPPPPPPPDDDDDCDSGSLTNSEQQRDQQEHDSVDEDGFTRENSTRRLKKEIYRRMSNFLGTSSNYMEEETSVKPPPDLTDLLRQEREVERSLYGGRSPTQVLMEAEIARREREIIENVERSEQLKQQQLAQELRQPRDTEIIGGDKGDFDDHMQYQESHPVMDARVSTNLSHTSSHSVTSNANLVNANLETVNLESTINHSSQNSFASTEASSEMSINFQSSSESEAWIKNSDDIHEIMSHYDTVDNVNFERSEVIAKHALVTSETSQQDWVNNEDLSHYDTVDNLKMERCSEVIAKHALVTSDNSMDQKTVKGTEFELSEARTYAVLAPRPDSLPVVPATSQPEEFKKLAELEEEMMRHDKDMLRRVGHFPPTTATQQATTAQHISNNNISQQQQETHNTQTTHTPHSTPQNLPIQEFYTAPAYESIPPVSLSEGYRMEEHKIEYKTEESYRVEQVGYKEEVKSPLSPGQYSALASPHPYQRSNSQTQIDTGNLTSHSPVHAARSSPISGPEPLPRRRKAPLPSPTKTTPPRPDLNTAERKEAMRVSRMASNDPQGNEQTDGQEMTGGSGQQMSKQTLLALSAIPKPRLTENESWITKKKSDAQKRDYSKHWLHQEAEQRRLEQQDRISRPKFNQTQPQMPQPNKPNPVNSPTKPAPAFHQNNPIYPPQNATPVYSSYPQALKNPSPIHRENNTGTNNANNNTVTNNNNNNSWRNQATTYQPHIPAPAPTNDKALPDSIIHNLTQRVNNKNKVSNSNSGGRLSSNSNSSSYSGPRDDNYHDYMNTDVLNNTSTSPPGHSPLYQAPGQSPPSTSQPQDSPSAQDQRLLSVSGKKKCSHCSEELGRGAAMIIESLRLFYHIPCFKCCVCGIQLGNGSSGADVRVRNHKLHCHNCYSNDEGMKFSKV